VFAGPVGASSDRGASTMLRKEPLSLRLEREGRQGFSRLFCTTLVLPFRSEGGVKDAMPPSVGASDGISGELLSGKSEWRPVPRSLGVG